MNQCKAWCGGCCKINFFPHFQLTRILTSIGLRQNVVNNLTFFQHAYLTLVFYSYFIFTSPFLFKSIKKFNPQNIVEKGFEEVINFVHGLISINQSINQFYWIFSCEDNVKLLKIRHMFIHEIHQKFAYNLSRHVSNKIYSSLFKIPRVLSTGSLTKDDT